MPILNINFENQFFSTRELSSIFGISFYEIFEKKIEFLKVKRDKLTDKIELLEQMRLQAKLPIEKELIDMCLVKYEQKWQKVSKYIHSLIKENTTGKINNLELEKQIVNQASLIDILQFEIGLPIVKESSKYVWFKSPFLEGEKPHLRVDKTGIYANTGLDDRTGEHLTIYKLLKNLGYNWKNIVDLCQKYPKA